MSGAEGLRTEDDANAAPIAQNRMKRGISAQVRFVEFVRQSLVQNLGPNVGAALR